ncbi:sulfate-transporting ATPase/ATP-binding cassette, subfamily B [Pseudomonas delhiensis]|uniref:Sulfate-transporting ATPase/ATP-binding cassette, subfamily B n=1 Tax=Pseudomonas delhiensis TaxID=366289 RepID=A0A239I8P4_9PSED|nr:ABC transporter ATP-binding protein [Pseudomonas delhiensis]SDJ56700.1 sulfate-transporting ATPase/ATP-binding cassette, subfamily B [Pseudomonas delhiensis]SNS89939.1 sulfate-transporting ATPase/ATP-binding cassette, subfamily B [Pseudomonas delhiensis]
MQWLTEGLRQVMATADTRAPRLWLGLALRVLERACAMAPFFLGFFWLGDPASGNQGLAQSASPGWLAVGLLALLMVQLLCSHFGQLNTFLGGYQLMHGYRRSLLDHVGRLPLGALRRERIGQLGERLTEDVKRIESIFTHVLAELLAALSVPLMFMLVLVWVDWRLTLALLVTLPLAFAMLNLLSGFFLAVGRRKQQGFLEAAGLLVEFIGGLRTLRLFDRAEPWRTRLDCQFRAIERHSLGVEAWAGSAIQLYRICIDMSLALMLAVAAWLAATSQLSALSWMLFALVANRLLDPLLDAAAYLSELRGLAQAQTRLQELMQLPEVQEPLAPASLHGHRVVFRNVGLRYPGQAQWALQGVEFVVEEGQMVAIVGPSGAGKSSLLHLLARFHDPQQGSIELGGVDLRQIRLEQLYQQSSFVFQDVQLFDGSVLDNLCLAKPEASLEEVVEVCRQTCCDEFIRSLPEGYDTRIGENGQRLSGGERQRLSIARALLKDAPILLLDEATASVDPLAQYEIQRGLSQLAQGRTLIVVAHRLGTVCHADLILVLEGGCVVERGRHEQLLAEDGLYAELWRRQQAG